MQDEHWPDIKAAEQDVAPRANRARVIVPVVILVLAADLIAWLVLRSRHAAADTFTGYVVADNLYLSSPVAGTVTQLWVARGQRVAAGAPLFLIDPTSLVARADQARAQIGQEAAGAEADRAALAKARVALDSAETEVQRTATDFAHYHSAELEMRGAVASQQLDQAHFAAESAVHQRNAAREDMLAPEARTAATRAQIAGTKAGLTDA